jgi:hypothetical protein
VALSAGRDPANDTPGEESGTDARDTMKPQPITTKIRPGGLRYESKEGGTAFPGAFGATMSCVRCGRHVPRSTLEPFSLAGSRLYRCKGGCAKE